MNQYPSTQIFDTQKITPHSYYLTEILVRILLLGLVGAIHLIFQPHSQYFTETELLHYYKRPRNESLAPPWFVIILITFLPVIAFLVPCTQTKHCDTPYALLAWSLACAINANLTEMGKLIVGRLRPDFFYRCFPNGKMTKDLRCTGSLSDVIEGRKSFPSGHSSFSFCSLGLLSMWMCGKMEVLSRGRGHAARIIACLTPLVVAGVVSLSRFCDNHHHWEDVLAGSIIGFTTSYFCYRQYYHPLDSPQAGVPYNIVTESKLFYNLSEEDCCCTKDLEVIKGIVRNKKLYQDFNKSN